MTADYMFKIISKCRVCGEDQFASLFSLGVQALTGVFPKMKEERITSGPIELIKCISKDGCGLVQLRQSYDSNEMYGDNYGYRSGLNSTMVRHLEEKVNEILNFNILSKGDLIIDIGSNDATTLRAYPLGQFELVGIDPTGDKFSQYYTDGITLIPDFFSAATVAKFFQNKKAKVISSFSMFYDLEDPVGFAKEIFEVLADDGIWVFEQSYLPAMLRTNSFDTICHEHLEFYSLKQILWICNRAGLKVLDVHFNEVNGGSFSITCSKDGAVYVPNYNKINQIVADEDALGLDTVKPFEDFRLRVELEKNKLMEFLSRAKMEGKKVYGLGASTKGNVLLQYYGIDSQLVAKIGEVNEDKFGAYTPGTLIPLVPESEILNSEPDYLLILPWHFRDFFEELPSMSGRKLIFPLPKFDIVDVY